MNLERLRNSRLARKCVPAHARDGAMAATIPKQLAHVGDDNSDVIAGRLDGRDKVLGTASGEGGFTDRPVGKDAEVLELFAEIEDCAWRFEQVGRGKDWDMRVGSRGIEGEAGNIHRGGEESGFKNLADAS